MLWVATAGIFNTTFFLAGVPEDPYAEEQQDDFPQGLRKITQYTFIPLSLLSLVILYVYATKILLTWTLPQGWVSYLVLGVFRARHSRRPAHSSGAL
jgi:hypothetical protein